MKQSFELETAPLGAASGNPRLRRTPASSWSPAQSRLGTEFMSLSQRTRLGSVALGLVVHLAAILFALTVLGTGMYAPALYPRWFAQLGALVWIFSIGLSWAGFVGRIDWINPMARVALGSFMPWLILLGYVWLRGARNNKTRAPLLA